MREVGHELVTNGPLDNAVWERWQARLQRFADTTGLGEGRRRLRATATTASFVTDHLTDATENVRPNCGEGGEAAAAGQPVHLRWAPISHSFDPSLTRSNTLHSFNGVQGWQLLLGAFNALDAAKLKVGDFLADILGKEWSSFTPHAWLDGCESRVRL